MRTRKGRSREARPKRSKPSAHLTPSTERSVSPGSSARQAAAGVMASSRLITTSLSSCHVVEGSCLLMMRCSGLCGVRSGPPPTHRVDAAPGDEPKAVITAALEVHCDNIAGVLADRAP